MKTKRFLALLLTIIMIGGMLPTAFAADTAEPVWDPYYCFNAEAVASWTTGSAAPKMETAVTKYEQLSRAVSTGAWRYVANVNSGIRTMYSQESGGAQFRVNSLDYLGNNAVILYANLEKSGNYKPSMIYDEGPAYGRLKVYFVPVEYAKSKGWTMNANLNLNAVFNDTEGVKLVADQDSWASAATARTNVTKAFDNVDLTAGDYYVLLSIFKGSGETNNGSKRTFFETQGLKLTRQTSFSVSSPKQIVKPGEEVTVSAVLSDNRDVPLTADINYTTSSSSVATVNDKSGLVTAVSEGEATITATAVYGGDEYTGSVKITVEEPWDPYYCFIGEASKHWAGRAKSMNDLVKEYDDLYNNISTGAWEYVNHKNTNARAMDSLANGGTTFRVDSKDNLGNNAVMLRARLEKSGNYKPSMIYNKNSTYGKLNVYFVPVAYAESKGWTMDDTLDLGVVFNDSGVKLVADPDGWASAAATKVPEEFDNVYLSAGKYYVLLSVDEGSGATTEADGKTYFVTQGLKLTRQTSFSVSAPKQTVNPGEKVEVSAVLSDNRDVPLTADINYTASPSSVATVDDKGLVTAVSKGTATITATAVYGGATYTGSVVITVEPWNPPVSLATSTSIEPNEMAVNSYTRGQSVTVMAEEIPGYTFRHWVRGTAEKGDWVSSAPSYTFTLATNTYLTAVYTQTAAEGAKIVEFFSGNGEYITEKTVEDGAETVETPEDPKMTGFDFWRWIVAPNNEFDISDITSPLTRVVAEFKDTVESFIVDGDSGLKYDAAVTRNSENGNEVAWYRDGNLVGYGPSYTYHVWAGVGEITQRAITTKAPVVYLDPTAKGTARMIEYDAGDKEIVEVGILFGDGTNMTVDSCMYKATSQKSGIGIDGQFTAKPANDSYANALGYMIYKDGTEYKVVYSD